MTYEEHFADLLKRGWNDRDAAIIAQCRVDDEAIKNAPPVPRPTCGTCPHWDRWDKRSEPSTDVGDCMFFPVISEKDHSSYCGQHPDMAAWIEKEWPKVRAGR